MDIKRKRTLRWKVPVRMSYHKPRQTHNGSGQDQTGSTSKLSLPGGGHCSKAPADDTFLSTSLRVASHAHDVSLT